MKQTEKNMIDILSIKNMYLNKIINLSLSRFKWENLPISIDPSFVERQLLTCGKIAFFMDNELSEFLCLPFAQNGEIDQYGNPTRIIANGLNGYRKQCDNNSFCVIWDNLLHFQTMPFLEYYANRLAEIDMTASINLNAQKTPIIVTAPDNLKLTAKNFAMQYSTYNQEIYCYDSLKDKLPINVMNLDAPYLLDKLRTEKKETFSEILEILGIPSAVEKKERMLVDEIGNKNSVVMANLQSNLLARQQACDAINEKYRMNVSVEFVG